MVDLHDEGPGAEAPTGQAPRRRSNGPASSRRTRVAPGASTAAGEDLSGGIPRPTRPVVATVDDDRRSAEDEPALPPWVNDGPAHTTPSRTAAPPTEALVEAPEAPPEPLVIVPAVQPDEPTAPPATAPRDEAGAERPRPARRQLQVPRRARVRRVTRVIRYVDPWGVFKIALVFNLVGYATTLVAGVLLWNVAHATGTVDNVERFMESFGWESFEFRGGEIFHNAWIVGLFVVVGLTGLAVLTAATFNLVTDLVGGMRVTVLEEELVAVPARPWLRPAALPVAETLPATDDAVAEPAGEPEVDPWSRPGSEPG
jgi:hypothetical protein